MGIIVGLITALIYGVFISHKEAQIRNLLSSKSIKKIAELIFSPVTYYECRLTIQASPNQVWYEMTNTENWSKWKDGTDYLEALHDSPEAGDKVQAIFGLNKVKISQILKEYEPNKKINLANRILDIIEKGEFKTALKYTFIQNHSGFLGVLLERFSAPKTYHIREAKKFRSFIESKYPLQHKEGEDRYLAEREIIDETLTLRRLLNRIIK